jgi:RimJ/RimL family protein N-acetyltransferase
MMTAITHKSPTIRQALKSEIRELSQLRLEALQNEPEAFARDYKTDSRNSVADWEEWLRQRSDETTGIIFVACVDDQLAGMTGIARGHTAKTQHNGMIWGVYVRPGYRRQGIAGQLMEACIQWAGERGVKVVKLAVTNTNIAAIRFYGACGFEVYGVEPRALWYNDKYYDELLLVRALDSE